jgi:acyl-coenzyme A synthetase/AMP-(fatty) acid ligase
VHGSRPVLPTEIQSALEQVETPERLLITTPIHLRSIVETRLDWPKIDAVISATAPLGVELAGLAEQHLGAPVYEIYGCTEAGSIASRRTVASDIWELYDGVQFSATDTEGRPVVLGGHVLEPTALADVLELRDRTRFRLIGRAADQVGIAGKRASLGDLNQKLCGIEGVEDGVFIARGNDGDGKVRRLGCLYVSASLDEHAVMAELRALIDPAFLPRPIRRVDRLPYNELGKLPRGQLLAELDPGTMVRPGKTSTSAA